MIAATKEMHHTQFLQHATRDVSKISSWVNLDDSKMKFPLHLNDKRKIFGKMYHKFFWILCEEELDGLVQERCNSTAKMHWSYVFLALTHRTDMIMSYGKSSKILMNF